MHALRAPIGPFPFPAFTGFQPFRGEKIAPYLGSTWRLLIGYCFSLLLIALLYMPMPSLSQGSLPLGFSPGCHHHHPPVPFILGVPDAHAYIYIYDIYPVILSLSCLGDLGSDDYWPYVMQLS